MRLLLIQLDERFMLNDTMTSSTTACRSTNDEFVSSIRVFRLDVVRSSVLLASVSGKNCIRVWRLRKDCIVRFRVYLFYFLHIDCVVGRRNVQYFVYFFTRFSQGISVDCVCAVMKAALQRDRFPSTLEITISRFPLNFDLDFVPIYMK